MLTPDEYREAWPISVAATTEEANAFKRDFVEPAIEELTQECESESDKKEYKTKLGRLMAASILKYVRMVMDVILVGPRKDQEPKQPAKEADMTNIQVGMASLANQIAILSAQLKLATKAPGAKVAGNAEVPGDAKAKVLTVAGDHNCAYTVMCAGKAKSLDADVKLDLSTDSRARMGKLARKDVCIGANKAWLLNKKAFEEKFGSYSDLLNTILEEKRDSSNWPECPSGNSLRAKTHS